MKHRKKEQENDFQKPIIKQSKHNGLRMALRIVLIGTGIGLLLYPTMQSIYQEYQQQQLMNQWQATLSLIDQGLLEELEQEDISGVEPVDETILTEEQRIKREEEQQKAKQAAEARQAYVNANMLGILTIDKIKFKLPILKGATEKHLNLSVASLDHTGLLGEVGNLAIAGHRMRAYGKIFNRLDELEQGDTMVIDDGTTIYHFEVTEKLLVLPEEVWVLNSNGVDQEITLIACHPIYNPTHRLIIKGKRVD